MTAPTMRRRRLANRLRQLREQAGLTLEQVAERTDITPSTLSRIETARVSAKIVIVRALLDTYRVTGSRAEALLQLARSARQRGWSQSLSDDISAGYRDFIDLESEATVLRNYEPLVIPGLLQTRDYTAALLRRLVGPIMNAGQVQGRIEVRARRQERLRAAPPLRLHAIIEESALRHPIGDGAVMRAQLAHLAAAALLDNVDVQVVPASVGSHPGLLGGFAILEFLDSNHQPDVVYIETVAGQIYLDRSEDVERSHTAFAYLSNVAIDVRSSAKLISAMAREI